MRNTRKNFTPSKKGAILRLYNSGFPGKDALPVINQLLERTRVDEFLQSYLPRADRRCRIAPALGILPLLKNVLLSREPLYSIREWAARFAPEALGFNDSQLPSLNDDRMGRCLDRLFQSDITSLVLALVAHVIKDQRIRGGPRRAPQRLHHHHLPWCLC
jgi:Domain of unknown function (DUF4277)